MSILQIMYQAAWQCFPNITHIKVNNGLKSRQLFNFFKMKFFRAYPSLKLHIFYSSNGLRIRIFIG